MQKIDAALSPAPQPDAAPAIQHASDCAIHNEPALPKGDCSCGAVITLATEDYEILLGALEKTPENRPLAKLMREKSVFEKPSPLPADDLAADNEREDQLTIRTGDDLTNCLLASPLPADDVVRQIRDSLDALSRQQDFLFLSDERIERIAQHVAANLLRQSAPVEELPPSLQVTPNIPHEKQSLEQLRAERDYWQRMVETAPGFPSAKAADAFRRSCEVWIARRDEGERPASPPADAAGTDKAIEAVIRLARYRFDHPLNRSDAAEVVRAVTRTLPIPASPTDAAVKTLEIENARLRDTLDGYACAGLGKCTEPRLKDGTCIRASVGTCGHDAHATLAENGVK